MSELKKTWLRTPLGRTVLYAHPGHEWDAIHAMERSVGGKVKVVEELFNDADRAKRAQKELEARQ